MPELILPRRKLLTGLAALIAAPTIVRVASLMPVKALGKDFLTLEEFAERFMKPAAERFARCQEAGDFWRWAVFRPDWRFYVSRA